MREPASPTPPTSPRQDGAAQGGSDGIETYHTIAETVGFVPSVRAKDNIFQATAIIVALAIGAGSGYLLGRGTMVGPGMGALIGGVAGLVVGTLLSGFALMILGWVRALNR